MSGSGEFWEEKYSQWFQISWLGTGHLRGDIKGEQPQRGLEKEGVQQSAQEVRHPPPRQAHARLLLYQQCELGEEEPRFQPCRTVGEGEDSRYLFTERKHQTDNWGMLKGARVTSQLSQKHVAVSISGSKTRTGHVRRLILYRLLQWGECTSSKDQSVLKGWICYFQWGVNKLQME